MAGGGRFRQDSIVSPERKTESLNNQCESEREPLRGESRRVSGCCCVVLYSGRLHRARSRASLRYSNTTETLLGERGREKEGRPREGQRKENLTNLRSEIGGG